MANNQKKFQKKKERERAVRKKVLHRREALRRHKAEEREKEDQYEREYQSPPKPIVNDQKKNAAIMNRLQENMKILEALEQEYLTEMETRKDRNDDLEAQGYITLPEKLEALSQKAAVLADGNVIKGTPLESTPEA